MERRNFLGAVASGLISPSILTGAMPISTQSEGENPAPWQPAEWLRNGLIQAEGWHEPYIFVVRRGGERLDAHTIYEQAQSEAAIQQLKEQGVGCYENHFYKGFGIVAEKPEMEKTQRVGEIVHRCGMKLSTYIQWNTMMYETFFREEPRAKGWIQRDSLGRPILLTYGYQQSFRYRPCFSCQEYLDYLKRVVKLAVVWAKADFIDFDNFDLNPEPDSCHCQSCVSGFRNYLKQKYSPAERKERFGFEVVDFINPPLWNRQNPPEKMKIIYDPAIQEWVDYRCSVMADALKQISTYVKSLNPEVAIEINPQGITGRNRAWETGIDYRRLFKWTDVLVTEESDEPSYHSDGRLISKIRSYKLTRAYHKILNPVPQAAFDLAEALAFNQTIGWVGSYPISEDYLKFISFYRQYRPFYIGAQDVSAVAIFRSYASIAFHNARCQWSAILAEQSVIQARLPFSLVFEDRLRDLSAYRVLVLPDSECLSDQQLGEIRKFVQNGGGLVAIGASGLYDEWRRLRPTPGLSGLVDVQPAARAYEEEVRAERGSAGPSVRKEYGNGRVVYIPRLEPVLPLPPPEPYFAITQQFWNRPRNWWQVVEAIQWAARGRMPVSIPGPPYLVMNLVSQPAESRQVLHLLNYDYKRTTSIVQIPVTCELPEERTLKSIRLFSPDSPASEIPPPQAASSIVRFTVPELKTYTMVVMSW